MARIDFDSTRVPDMQPNGLIPKGEYQALMVHSELKDTRAMDGAYLEGKFRITDGPYSGIEISDRFIMNHRTKPLAIAMGQSKLKKFCRALGRSAAQDSNELENQPLIICVEQRKQRESDRVSNEIVDYKPLPSQRPTAVPGAPMGNGPGGFQKFGAGNRP